jgi:hypothetical protein
VRHPDCGQLVEVLPDGSVEDLDGDEHLCRDYLAWYGPADGRDPAGLDVVPHQPPSCCADRA